MGRKYDWEGEFDSAGCPVGIVSTLADVARVFKRSYHTVKHWRLSGMPVEPDGRFDLAKIARWKSSRKGDPERHRPERNDNGSATETLNDLRRAQTQHVEARVCAMQRQIQAMDDQYVDRTDVLQFFDSIMATIDHDLSALDIAADLPASLSPATRNDLVAQLRRRLDRYVRQLGSFRTKLDSLPSATRPRH